MAEERAVPDTAEWAELAPPHLARYLFAVDFARGKRVLDAGTGSGYGAALLKMQGAASVQAIDIDAETIRQAQERFPLEGVTFAEDDCETLARTTEPFDLICNFENIEHLGHPDRFLAAAARRLSPDGVLLISTPDRATTPPFVQGKPANPFHVQEWYRDEFQALLTTHFEAVDLRVQVQTTALQSRIEAVAALRQRLVWGNPPVTWLWRKFPFFGKRTVRPWKKLAGLAAPSVTDYPIVAWELRSLYGTPCFHVAICRKPEK
jgi:SAM-dependent methyltransferase